jgi:hypothetical protein
MRVRAVLLLATMVGLTSYMASRATPTVAVNIADGNDAAQQHLLSPQRQRLLRKAPAAPAVDSAPRPPALGYEEQQTVQLVRLKLQAGPEFAVRDVRLALHPDTLLVCGEFRRTTGAPYTPFARVNSALFVGDETGDEAALARHAFSRCEDANAKANVNANASGEKTPR